MLNSIYRASFYFICNKVYNGDAPFICRQSCIIPLPKKGNLSLTSNYRGISLTCLIEGIKAKNLKAVLDFKKAFDSIHRGKLLDILRAYGVQGKVVDGILYTDTIAKVLSPDGETNSFESQPVSFKVIRWRRFCLS